MKYLIQAEHPIYSFTRDNKPAITITPGEELIVQTGDVVERELSFLNKSSEETGGELIECGGPVFVEGAEPGDVLAVHVNSIELADRGIVLIKPGMGVLGDKIKKPESIVTPVKETYVQFSDSIRVPLRPMIGIIGVAPKDEDVPCVFPGSHGGNLDTLDVTTGNTLYLPVYVPGALLGIGDVHSAMGDGEVCLTAIETMAKLSLTIDVIHGKTLHNPQIETPTEIITVASCDTLESSLRKAVEDMVEVVQERCELSQEEALMLISVSGDAKISQVVNPYPTVRVCMPKVILGS